MRSNGVLGKTPRLAYQIQGCSPEENFSSEVIEPSSPLFVGVMDLDMHEIGFSQP